MTGIRVWGKGEHVRKYFRFLKTQFAFKTVNYATAAQAYGIAAQDSLNFVKTGMLLGCLIN